MTLSSSKILANELHRGLADSDPGRARRSTQSPEDVVRMLLLAAPDAGRPPPEIVGAALKAAGVPVTDQNVIRALEEAAGARGGTPTKEDVSRARSGAHDYQVSPRVDDELRAEPIAEIKYQTPTTPAITFNNGLAQMHKKPIQAMRLLESMRASMPDVAALQRMDEIRENGSFTIPTGPEEVVRTLCLVAPDAGRPPPEVVGAALKAAGIAATEENLTRALREAQGSAPSDEDMRLARTAAVQYSSSGLEMPSGARGYPDLGDPATASTGSRPPNGTRPEEVIEALLRAAPGLGQPPPEVVGLALRQAGVPVDEEAVRRALVAAGERKPSQNAIRMALAAGQEDE